METLPQELITLIASYLPDQGQVSELAPCATISQNWQLAVECHTFRSIRLKSTELPHLTQILTGHRIPILSTLTYEVVIPSYADHRCAKFETQTDIKHNNEAFTKAVCELFDMIRSWQADEATSPSRSLALTISAVYSPMDKWYRPKAKRQQDEWDWQMGKRADLWENRYKDSVVGLLGHTELPLLSNISSFEIWSDRRCIEPMTAALLASKIPQLQNVKLELRDNQKNDPSSRVQYRYGLASELERLSIEALHKFSFTYRCGDPYNQYFSAPSVLLDTDPRTDHLCLALQKLSRSPILTYFSAQSFTISPSLYWPTDTSTLSTWSNLQHHEVKLNMTTPTGEWYFIRNPLDPIEENDGQADSPDLDPPLSDPDSDSDPDSPLSNDSHIPDTHRPRLEARNCGDYPFRHFRTVPCDELMNPLLHAMARAAAHMPSLRTMTLTSTLRNPKTRDFAVSFFGVGERSKKLDIEAGISEKARLYVCAGTWRPAAEVLNIWREGRPGLEIRFVEWVENRDEQFQYPG
ncbi:MAG: hypothetical protein Q9183_003665, partial [Haloplaca sp. 2 TL-2023]